MSPKSGSWHNLDRSQKGVIKGDTESAILEMVLILSKAHG